MMSTIKAISEVSIFRLLLRLLKSLLGCHKKVGARI